MLNSAMLCQMLFLLFTVKRCLGVPQFTLQPTNKTVNYGDFVQFECRVEVNQPSDILSLYIGATNILSDGNKFSLLDQREFGADKNGTLGRVWILINNKTLELFENFWCNLVYGNHDDLDSNVAYIDVKYPECISQSQSPIQHFIQPTSTQTHHFTATSLVQNCQPTCTCNTISHESGELNVDNHRAVFYYQVAFGVCLSLVILMLIVFVIIVARMCIIHRIKIREKSSQDSANRICNALVRNPIYAGPLYETVQPRFETLVTTTQKATTSSSASNSSDQSLLLVTTTTDKTRYVSKPSHSPVPQSGEPSPYTYPQDHCSSHEDCCFNSTESDDCMPAAAVKQTNSDNRDSKHCSSKEKEDAYTVMNPAGTFAASLSGGWDKFDHEFELTKKESTE